LTYETPQALRMALEQRLLARSEATGVSLDRLRRRVLFERIIARLVASEPGQWVVKGGMAIEVRLSDEARLTKDLDLGLRDDVASGEELRDRLIEALSEDLDDGGFVLTVGPARQLMGDAVGVLTWRVSVAAHLADKPFHTIQVDISPRQHELDATDFISMSNSLDFAGVPAPAVEVIDVARHAAEKFHGMLREFGDRENSRVRDLADLVILSEHSLIDPAACGQATRKVWAERDGGPPPPTLPSLPTTWPVGYERLAADQGLDARTFQEAVIVVTELWSQMFPAKES
jgi:hypothetical protein